MSIYEVTSLTIEIIAVVVNFVMLILALIDLKKSKK